MTKKEPIRAARNAARQEGCNCNPEVRLWKDQAGNQHANVAHDAWCRHLSQLRWLQ